MEPAPLSIDPKSTALILIDLQQGIVGRPTTHRPGVEVVRTAVRLLDAFRQHGALVVLVHVEYRDEKERVKVAVDAPMAVAYPPNWSDFVPDVGPKAGDIVITKRQWGAFYGTELDLQLRRRGIRTIVLGGISTNFGVESTARNASELGYEQIFAEDAMSGLSEEGHRFAIQNIFPRLGRVRSTDEILRAIQ